MLLCRVLLTPLEANKARTFIVNNHKFEGGSSVRSFKGGEKIKAVISIHGTFGKERGLAVTRVFECTVPSSTADDPSQPGATTPL
jgi:hypothetical protein